MPSRAKAHVDMHAFVWSAMMALVGGVRTLAGALVPSLRTRRTWWLGQRRRSHGNLMVAETLSI